VTYTSKWESLSDALDRVMQSTDLSREQAETDICRAISDRAIGIQAKLVRHAIRFQTSHLVVGGSNLHIPTPLEPHDLDWQQSRPTNPWFIRDLPPLHSGPWHLELLELSRPDVIRELLPSQQALAPTSSKAPVESNRKKRTAPKLDAAKAALRELFPRAFPLKMFCSTTNW